MNEFIRSSNNNSTSSSSSNGINNNSGERKKSDVIRDESCFVDKKIFNLFMPKECIFEEYINPEEAVRETLVRIKRVCEKGMLRWYNAVQGGTLQTEATLYCQKE